MQKRESTRPLFPKMKSAFALALFLTIALVSSVSALNYRVGAVEGFYWPSSEAVNGQSGSYSIDQRLELINLLAAQGAGVYWYAPQNEDTLKAFNGSMTTAWSRTASLGASTGVAVVYGLRPGYLDATVAQSVISKIGELHTIGIRNYSLNMDDAEGASSDAQKQLQVQLVSNITQQYPDMHPYIFVPSEYFQTHDNNSVTKQQWSNSLSIGDQGMPSSMAFGFTGAQVTPASMAPSNFPTLSSSRRMAFWDNWIALDSATALPWGLIGDRSASASLFNDPRYGYILNMAYPLERTIHQLHCLGALIAGNTSCDATTVATAWAQWLSENGYAHSHSVSDMATALTTAIQTDKSYNSIAELEADYPNLSGVFSSAPVAAPDTPSATPPTPSNDNTSFKLPIALLAFIGLIAAATL